MRVYVDTSVLVAAHTRETYTAMAQEWLAGQSGGGLILSTWMRLECESALAIKLRRGEMDAAGQIAASVDIAEFAAYFAPHAVPTEVDYRRARELCRHAPSGLRAGDALHLAIAQRLQASHFATLDRTLANNAAAHGMTLAIPIFKP